ncbi:MAG: HflC protein [SAR324 cluster bacterium]|uniref:Protein HflC n=1 Tax=SAR324 cluster bacterium TaxID=2024889 RepID=A0A2A4TB75_9DELT|nr:MAG: HflC protein [SAR324 cluster bacterium]
MNRSMFGIFVALAIAFVGFNSFYIVDEGEQVIITQFGEPVGGATTEAGLYFKIPIVQKVLFFDKRILKWDGDPNEIPTSDKKYIWVDTTARWRISDPLLFLQRMNNMNRATLALNDLINGAVRDFVTKNNLIEIIRSSDWKVSYQSTNEETEAMEEVLVGRDRFSELVLESVAQTTKGFGIELLDVLVKRINYTQQVRETVYTRMISERQRIAAQKRSEGEANKAEILGTMEKDLKTIVSEAYKKAETIRGKADGAATAIYGKAYNKDPEFYAFLTSLDSYEVLLGKNTKLILQADAPIYDYLKNYQKVRK